MKNYSQGCLGIYSEMDRSDSGTVIAGMLLSFYLKTNIFNNSLHHLCYLYWNRIQNPLHDAQP